MRGGEPAEGALHVAQRGPSVHIMPRGSLRALRRGACEPLMCLPWRPCLRSHTLISWLECVMSLAVLTGSDWGPCQVVLTAGARPGSAPASHGTAGPCDHHAGGRFQQCLELCKAIHRLHSIQTAGAVAAPTRERLRMSLDFLKTFLVDQNMSIGECKDFLSVLGCMLLQDQVHLPRVQLQLARQLPAKQRRATARGTRGA